MAGHRVTSDSSEPGAVNFVVAFLAEARPVIEHFGMKPVESVAPFPVHECPGRRLIISGLGKTAAAAASGYFFRRGGNRNHEAWVNLGLGGHADLPIGTCRLAHTVIDEATGEKWYPPLAFEPPCPGAEVRSVDRPETGFPHDAIYDMEASGFFGTCVRWSSRELVQVFKVVADNRSEPARRPTRSEATELIGHAVPRIEALTSRLAERLHAHSVRSESS